MYIDVSSLYIFVYIEISGLGGRLRKKNARRAKRAPLCGERERVREKETE